MAGQSTHSSQLRRDRSGASQTGASSHSPSRGKGRAVLQLQRLAGNQAVSQLVQGGNGRAGGPLGQPLSQGPDRQEQEAARMSEQVTRGRRFSTGVSQVAGPAGISNGGPERGLRGGEAPGGGTPLPPETRRGMEFGFQADLSRVRLHTGAEAAQKSRELNARAFTFGQDIYFGAGQYRPGSAEGGKLLAHELTHTVQQSQQAEQGLAPSIQRQPAGAGSPAAEEITAQAVFPFPVGSRVLLTHLLGERAGLLSSAVPEMGAALNAIQNKVAVVKTASSDQFEAVVQDSISLPAFGDEPAKTLQNTTLRLTRTAPGVFDLELAGQADPQAQPTVLFAWNQLQASRKEGGVLLSSGQSPLLRAFPGSQAGETKLEVFTAPFVGQLPEVLRGMVPAKLELLQLTRLKDVQPGSAEEKAAIESVASRAAAKGRVPRQTARVGAGFLKGPQFDPILSTAWQINLRPSKSLGSLVQVPLEIQLQYAPTTYAVLGSATSGFESSLSQLNIPVHVRVVAGLAGGQIPGRAEEGRGRKNLGGFGATVGGGAGVEIYSFQVDLRYEYLVNLVGEAPNGHLLLLRLGKGFD